MNPLVSDSVRKFVVAQELPVLTWRFFWAVPLPLLIAICFASVVDLIRARLQAAMAFVCAAIVLLFFLTPREPWAVEELDFADYYKVERAPQRVAAQLLESPAPVLANERVAIALAGFRHAPDQLFVRGVYALPLIDQIGKDEVRARTMVQGYLEKGVTNPKELALLMKVLKINDVRTVVQRRVVIGSANIAEALQKRGFKPRVFEDFVIYERDA